MYGLFVAFGHLFINTTVNLDKKKTLGKWKLEFDHRTLCINLKYMKRFACKKAIEDNKLLFEHKPKLTPMHSKMVEDMVQMTMIQHDLTLECK